MAKALAFMPTTKEREESFSFFFIFFELLCYYDANAKIKQEEQKSSSCF